MQHALCKKELPEKELAKYKSRKQGLRKIRISGLLAGAVAAIALAASGSALAATSKLMPSPIAFSNHYGDMTFPAEYPQGTTISLTQWSHFVPSYDKWFDQYAAQWGKAHNVKVVVNHISIGDIPSTLAASIAAGKGPTLVETIAAPAAFIDGLQPLNDVNQAAAASFGTESATCVHSSYLPAKKEWYGFCHGWVPDPGVYRSDLWKDAGYPNGPESYADLLAGGKKIFQKTGKAVAVGMSPELDSEFYARALIWSFGGSIQNKKGEVVLDSPATIAAVTYQKKLFENTMTPEVFAWNPASNNQAYIAGAASYIQNSISFFRSAQKIGSKVTSETGFRPGLKGPDHKALQPAHVWFIYVMPKYVKNKTKIQAAKNFMLDLENNYSNASYHSKFYNFPAYASRAPQLFKQGGWLDNDPWGSQPADMLSILKTAEDWTVWPGYPGYANPAVGEVYQTHIISTMMANAARGKVTPKEAVEHATKEIKKIFAKWRARGYVGSGD